MSMKSIRQSVLVAAVGVAVLVGGLWAGRLAAGPMAYGRHFSAEKIFARIADRLDLSDSQRGQIKDVLRTRKDAIVAAIQTVRSARLALRGAVDSDAFDENSIRAKASALGKAQADAAVLRAQIRAEIMPVLNDEQKEKLAAFRSHAENAGDRVEQSIQEFLSK